MLFLPVRGPILAIGERDNDHGDATDDDDGAGGDVGERKKKKTFHFR